MTIPSYPILQNTTVYHYKHVFERITNTYAILTVYYEGAPIRKEVWKRLE